MGHLILADVLLHDVEDGVRRRVVPARVLVDRLAGLLEQHTAADGVLLQELVHQRRLALTGLDSARRQSEGLGDRDGLQRGGVHHQVHQTHLFRLVGAHVLPREHHVQRGLDANQLRQVVCASHAGHEAQLHLGQSEHGLGRGGGDAVVAVHGPLEPAAQRRAVDRRHEGDLGLVLQVLEEGVRLHRHLFQLRLVLHGFKHVDVRPRDEVVRL
mmetsp:Transcript_27649/g.60951  ORF Transcript_27649/g.60951 Transcript_27649/m.60951 type:complete len:213 (+) Transcript_27649:1433-2071(+)